MEKINIFPDDNPGIMLAFITPENMRDTTIYLVKKASEIADQIIYLSVNQPAPYLNKQFKKSGIDVSKIYYIDTITKYAIGKPPDDFDQGTFLNTPSDLTGMSVAISECIKEYNKGKVVVCLDSVNAMLIHMPSKSVSKFIHFITSKMKVLNISGIYFAIEEGLDPVIISQLTVFSDSIFKTGNLPESPENTD
ncbi:DUF7504 family protein [Methanoplanus endosymbiosus]|uniref:KaiC-like domain-containing protein n=1 Tax=Methanoplanus endosymbiosus TaxID=33865 RepID=A0A9E7PMS2_9EURY|nr:hypothetical protein [Methanoplanus endosymbiosus]UUX93110.1 hypothetical protein L6E24_03025 [Methanoplanus endosymbiosus]